MRTALSKGGLKSNAAIDFLLYLITDRHQTNGRPLLEVVRAALAGGAKAVQLREKDLADAELLELARAMRALTDEFGARLIINKRCDICLAVGADGVHLGVEGVSVAEARHLYADKLLIGYSAHALDEACRAERDGADFVTFGPVYRTPSKASYGEPLGVPCLKEACRRLHIPLFALGGVASTNISEVMTAGASGVALISAVISADDPMKKTASLLKLIEEYDTHS